MKLLCSGSSGVFDDNQFVDCLVKKSRNVFERRMVPMIEGKAVGCFIDAK
jgi:hypothetical protein